MLYENIKNLTFNQIIGIEALAIALCVFLLSVLTTRLVLPVLRAKKLNQPINMYVKEHAGKAGTPTMGGICFIIATLVCMLAWVVAELCGVIGGGESYSLLPLVLTLCLAVGNGLIGFIDDYKKLIKKDNEGLSEKQKMLLQIVIALAYLAMMGMTQLLPTAIRIPFTDLSLELGIFAYPLYLLVIIGFVNSTNITDGLDGLASSVGVAISVALVATSVILGSRYDALISATLLGALLGFLVFNHYPARVFMGDTGSLYIGGLIMGVAISSGELISVMIMSLVYILDMLSSLAQRLYYKATHGKRLFKKAPVHHHFQLLGWSEIKIVTVFFTLSLAFSVLGAFGILL